MLLLSKKSLLPPDFTPAILAEFPQPVTLHRNFAVFCHAFPDKACFMGRPHAQRGASLGNQRPLFGYFSCLLSGKNLENNDLFAIRKKLQVSQKEQDSGFFMSRFLFSSLICSLNQMFEFL